MIMDEGLCNAVVIDRRGLLAWPAMCEGLGPEQ